MNTPFVLNSQEQLPASLSNVSALVRNARAKFIHLLRRHKDGFWAQVISTSLASRKYMQALLSMSATNSSGNQTVVEDEPQPAESASE